MFWKYPLRIQTYYSDTNQWSFTEFKSKEEHLDYCKKQFKMPADAESNLGYNIRNAELFQIEGLKYSKEANKSGRPNFEGGVYTKAIKGTHKWKQYWANEKNKVLNGLIVDGIFIPPFYYWYLNFCPIYDEVQKRKRLADVWDGDLWYMHYCMVCILSGKHIGGIKGRQKGYSYKHMAMLYWCYCWFENSVSTIGAFTEDLVKKSWRYLEGYRKHINTTTAWKRGPTVPRSLEWNEQTIGADNQPYGLLSKLSGVTFKQNPSNDVGGGQTFFNYEEPGVSPTILETIEFIRPAVERGNITTGIIIACGSVGDLDDADGIKQIFYHPADYNFYPIKNIWDKKSEFDECCIFISEAYNMIGVDDLTGSGRPFMDENGNSDVKLALAWIAANQEKINKSKKRSELKQLAHSQKCISPEQAFAQRSISEFPIDQLKRQQDRIHLKEEKNAWEFKPLKGLLSERDGKIILDSHALPAEHEYPTKPHWLDKRGVWTIYELPDPNAEFFTYFAGIDPVEVDFTDTSHSVASIYIFKTAIEVTYKNKDGKVKTRLEGDKLVACYNGRFNNPDKTNEQMWFGLKWYNAFGYAERNKPNFINYMRRIGKAERYLAKEGDVPIFKDLNIKNGNNINNSKFGFHKGDNTEIWRYFKAYTKEYFATEYGRNTILKEGIEETIKVFTGIDRIDDYWLLEEFIQFVEGKGNYDRLVAFMAALFICKIYQQNRFIKRRNDIKQEEQPVITKRLKETNMLGGEVRLARNKRQKPQSML